METKKKTSVMLSICKVASYYIDHYNEINKNTDLPIYIYPYYNPYTR